MSPAIGEDDPQAGPANGDYRLVVDREADDGRRPSEPARQGSFSTFALAGQETPTTIWLRLTNHPLLPVFCYCAASIMMTVINKFVVSGAHFTMNFLLLAIQSILITFRDFDINDARKWFPISFLLVSVIYTGSKSLQFLSIPVYTIFKNMTIILIAYGEVLWFAGSITPLTMGSFSLMILSSVVAAYSDIMKALGPSDPYAVGTKGTSGVGYAWMIVNCFVSAGYVLAMRKRIKITNFRDWDTMFYNNLLSIPVLIFFSLTFEDWSSESLSKNFPAETRTKLLFAMGISGAAAVFISYTTAWCVRTTSSTTFSMVGALNKLPVAASGMLFFGDPVTISSVLSIFIGFVAGLVYSMAKQMQSAAAAGNVKAQS
ncbi:GDP-mannose transporter [Pseudohyphozyma bogoriensis]|nr:GDP-mannose transporter [Pseudohyphozyma bogoriensis]